MGGVRSTSKTALRQEPGLCFGRLNQTRTPGAWDKVTRIYPALVSQDRVGCFNCIRSDSECPTHSSVGTFGLREVISFAQGQIHSWSVEDFLGGHRHVQTSPQIWQVELGETVGLERITLFLFLYILSRWHEGNFNYTNHFPIKQTHLSYSQPCQCVLCHFRTMPAALEWMMRHYCVLITGIHSLESFPYQKVKCLLPFLSAQCFCNIYILNVAWINKHYSTKIDKRLY